MVFKNFIRAKRLLFFYKKLIKNDDLCYDIGANIGKKSRLFLSLGAKVIAFEPQDNCHRYLSKIQKKYFDFKINKLAIGAKNTELNMFIGNHIEIATLSKKFKYYFTTDTIYWNKEERIKVVTLNSQIELYGLPNFCKIDAEGYEHEILMNLTYKIPLIEFEFTGGFIKETLLCISKLDDLGDYSFNYIRNENPKFKLTKWVSAKKISTEIKSMNIENLHGNIFAKLN